MSKAKQFDLERRKQNPVSHNINKNVSEISHTSQEAKAKGLLRMIASNGSLSKLEIE